MRNTYLFAIKIKLQSGAKLAGLSALDERRRLGLYDGNTLNQVGLEANILSVDEIFAREYFRENEIVAEESIYWHQLQKGDIEEGRYNINLTLTPVRMREIFIKNRTPQKRKQK